MSESKTASYCPTGSNLETYAWRVVSGLKTFTADALHVLETEIELHNRDPRVIGALLKSLEAQGKIERTGVYLSSRRPECHGRPVAQWRVVDKPRLKTVSLSYFNSGYTTKNCSV